MTTTNTYGKQVVVPLTNKSGGGVIAGDVVIVDTGNNDAFTTTTSAGFTGLVGIAQDTIANNAAGRVLIGGYAALINTSASVTRGHYGATHTVAKQAADAGTSRTTGTFVQFLTGGTTPDGTVFNPDLGTGGSTIITKDEGSTLSSSVTTLDFVGAGVVASGAGATTTVTVAGGGITRTQLGYATIGGSFETTTGTPLIFKSVTAATDGFLASISAYVKGNGTNVGSIWAGLYTDSTGPSLLTAMNEVPEWGNGTKGVYINTSGRWLTFPIGKWIASGTYWLCIGREQDVSSDLQIAYDGSGSDKTAVLAQFWQVDVSLTGSITTGSNKYSIYADFLT